MVRNMSSSVNRAAGGNEKARKRLLESFKIKPRSGGVALARINLKLKHFNSMSQQSAVRLAPAEIFSFSRRINTIQVGNKRLFRSVPLVERTVGTTTLEEVLRVIKE